MGANINGFIYLHNTLHYLFINILRKYVDNFFRKNISIFLFSRPKITMKYTDIPKANRGRKRIYDFAMEVGECKEFDFSISVRQSAYKFFKDKGWDIATRSINNKLTIYRTA